MIDLYNGVRETAAMTQMSHNCIVLKTSEYLNKETNTKSTTEPLIYEAFPNINNIQRADLLVKAQDGHFIPQTGFFDVMTKVVTAPHTQQARTAARTKATREGIVDIIKITNLEIQAALQVGFDSKLYKYRNAINMGIKIKPLIISAGGTLHQAYQKFIREAIPNNDMRNGLIMDMSVR